MIFKSPYSDIQIPEVPLTPFILGKAQRFADRIAFVDANTGRKITFSQFRDAVVRTAYGLHQLGLKRGEVFAIYAPNCVEYAVAFHSVSLLGGIITTANSLCTAADLSSQLRDAGARFLLTVPELMDKAAEAASDSDVKEILVIGKSGFALEFARIGERMGQLPNLQSHPEDVVAMPYSSGTTGFPKGVMLTHRNLVSNLLQIEASRVFHSGDVVVCVLPLFHIYGLMVIMNETLYLGCTNVIIPKFDFEVFLRVMQTYRVTIAPVVPPIVLALANHPAVASYDLTSVKTVFSAAAPLAAGLIEACTKRIGCVLKQGYGMTEASPATHMSPYEANKMKIGSVGVCVPNTEYKIIDESENELEPGETGQVLVRGPQVMKGYLNRVADTNLAIDPEGWLRTGDIGLADEAGNLTIVDRVKELIKYKGYQVAPAELEALLLTHPAVADAAVIPSPDPEAGEVPKAFIVLKQPVEIQELQRFIAERVAPYKKIRRFQIIDSIPRSASGKILRRILVEKERAN